MPSFWPELQAAIDLAKKSTVALSTIAAQLDQEHLRFTLDGRLVGDIGELIVARHYDIHLHKKQRGRHDAVCRIDGHECGVQIKCRVKSWVLDFTSQPELLIVLRVNEDWKQWQVLYNGPGSVVTSGTKLTLHAKGHLMDGESRVSRRLWLEDLERAGANQASDCLRVPERKVLR